MKATILKPLSGSVVGSALFAACANSPMTHEPSTTAAVDTASFGTLQDGRSATSYTLRNRAGMTAVLTDFGATLVSFEMPDSSGAAADVVLGFDDVSGYEGGGNQHFGCIAGRVANRLEGAQFELDGVTYALDTNDGPNTLHGGNVGFGQRLWLAEIGDGAQVTFRYLSPAGEEGFPGTLSVAVTYSLTDQGELFLRYEATTDAPTLCNLTSHSYFNLGGAGSGSVANHELRIQSDAVTIADDSMIPTGEIADVSGTAFDFRRPKPIGRDLPELLGAAALGYDHNYVLSGTGIRLAAELHDPESGRTLAIYTDQPGLQLYTGNHLFGQNGKGGLPYEERSACCLETQAFPAAPSHGHFPSIVLRPGETYSQTTRHHFYNR